MKKIFFYIITCVIASFTFKSNIAGHAVEYTLVTGLPLVVITQESEQIGHTWQCGTVWDRPLIEVFYTLLKQAEDTHVVLDLGAQTGSFSLLAKYFPQSTWYAFEPLHEAVIELTRNLQLNDIENVTVIEAAAADFNGFAMLKMPLQNAWGLSTLGDNVLRFEQSYQREVKCLRLDDFIQKNNIEKVHFMKLDTEGFELNILRGARKLIERDHPVILMEYNETNMAQCNVSKMDVDNFLFEMGYSWKLVSNEDILCIAYN